MQGPFCVLLPRSFLFNVPLVAADFDVFGFTILGPVWTLSALQLHAGAEQHLVLIWGVAEKVLHALCSKQGLSWWCDWIPYDFKMIWRLLIWLNTNTWSEMDIFNDPMLLLIWLLLVLLFWNLNYCFYPSLNSYYTWCRLFVIWNASLHVLGQEQHVGFSRTWSQGTLC